MISKTNLSGSVYMHHIFGTANVFRNKINYTTSKNKNKKYLEPNEVAFFLMDVVILQEQRREYLDVAENNETSLP